MKIRITAGPVSVEAELGTTPCAMAIAGVLPVTASPNEWGDEFYFEVPVHMPLDDTATRVVKVGDIGYWPPGDAIAIFFGPTPLSTGQNPVPASEVNVVGRITGDPALLKKARGSVSIRLEPAT
ncbi:MAG TPA: cyclophilin-like fold protein [Syntrophorhabdaceae bacterium]|nr:cyclophilin-like fold protein [Syntrophorhabdaceae bacterium]